MYQKLKHLGKRKREPHSNSEDDCLPGERSNQIIQGFSRLQSAACDEENAPPSVVASAPDTAQKPSLAAQNLSLGLNVLYEPPRTIDPIADIVFVHGLTGDSCTTWRHAQTGLYWPKELLSKDFADARILSFGYDADVVKFWNPASSHRVGNHAENLLGALSRIRVRTESVSPLSSQYSQESSESLTEHRETIFTTHSLGGLVIEDALRISRASAEEHIQLIERHTVAIGFLGTPHHGANLAAWAEFGLKISKNSGKA
ncbi:hypothetical protein H2201_001683 [Coniosporium apollinis]|uniref:DUF676 domain-containing protein n=1 Tax=Coniosporium apollinis TaxID=61459 RepID=A0ABQ9P2K3_9PEZI|nr:hypothetical protein H2201_001683 [Coniosporium apollinis]